MGSSDGSEGGGKEPLAPLTRRQYVLIGMLCLANLSSTVVFSCIAPFFPDEAHAKGASPTVTGMIFSCFELCMFMAAPIYGRNIDRIGAKRIYCGGMFLTSFTIVTFGFTTMLPDGPIFITACFVIRILESLGDAAFGTASMSITAKEFPQRTGTIIGFLETFAGMGFAVGPVIGGALYEVGGFKLPFLVLGSILFCSACLSLLLIPSPKPDPPRARGANHGVLGLLRIPSVVLMASSITAAAICLTFLDPTLEHHLTSFNISPVFVGLMFLLIGGIYALTAPFWGFVTDRTRFVREIMIGGALTAAVGLFLVGPSPLSGLPKTLGVIAAGQVCVGLGIGALFIPTFKDTLNSARAHGFPDSYETTGTVSGVFSSFFHLGGFFGPMLGGVGAEQIGFEWTATIISGLCLAVGVAIGAFQLWARCGRGGGAKDAPVAVVVNEETRPLLVVRPDDDDLVSLKASYGT